MKRSGVLFFISKKMAAKTAVALMLALIFQLGFPTVSWALTSGPGQPEFSSFSQASTSDMVDLYSGDFKYNIPLMSVPGPNGGYPLNISYQSGIGMDEEASWVGLGWSLNVGAVNRQMRGVPDDFAGEQITHKYHMREDKTIGFDFAQQDVNTNENEKEEFFGFPFNLQFTPPEAENTVQIPSVFFNTFSGLGTRYCPKSLKLGNLPIGLNLTFDSQNGVGISPVMSLSRAFGNMDWGLKISTSINNRNGIQGFNFASSLSRSARYKYQEDGLTAETTGLTSSNLSFSSNPFVPDVTMPTKSLTIPISVYINLNSSSTFGKFKSDHGENFILSGYYSESGIDGSGTVSTPAYGYLNTEQGSSSSMLDYQPGSFEYSKKIPNLAPGLYTYDIFTITGQGTGGMFRGHRAGVDALHVPTLTQSSTDLGLGFEAGKNSPTTTVVHVGIDVDYQSSTTQSGDWTTGTTDLGSNLHTATNGAVDLEKSYFKMYSEHTGDYYDTGNPGVDDHWANWKEDKALRVKLGKSGTWMNRQYDVTNEFIASETQGSPDITASGSTALAYKKTRQRRATLIQKFTYDQVQKYGSEKNMTFWTLSGGSFFPTAYSYSGTAGSKQIQEVSVTQPDGMRYVYGLPAKNTSHVDVNMSVPDEDLGVSGTQKKHVSITGSTTYMSNTGTGSKTKRYLNRTEVPSYMHSWLLTSARGTDYVDVREDGVSDDDLGYWAKFSYYRPYTDFKWRTPYNGANFNNASDDDPLDNTGYYSYGTREEYYVKKVETKTHVAVFYISERRDAHEANSEYASYNTNPTMSGERAAYKLDSIKLYQRADYATLNESATCIQAAHFEYDYSLCPGVINNDDATQAAYGISNINSAQGKLTLKKIYFTYQNSIRGKSSPYMFTYASGSGNPGYSQMNVDRWGNYTDNEGLYTSSGNQYYPYCEFPYTLQTENGSGVYQHQAYSEAWALKEVLLPTGGKIKMEYESDDYGYVEDQPAMQMFDLVDASGGGDDRNVASNSTTAYSIENSTAESYTGGSSNDYFKLYFKLDKNYGAGGAVANANFVKNTLCKNVKHVWFKTFMPLTKTADAHYDFVSGYAELAEVTTGGNGDIEDLYGLTGSGGNTNIAWISVKAVDINGTGIGNTHPFRKASFQYLKMTRPNLVFNMYEPTGNWASYITSIFGSVLNQAPNILQSVVGYYTYCQGAQFAEEIRLNGRSVVRLCEPDGRKYGGGHRVKSLKLHDNWIYNATASLSHEYLYGQEYTYTLEGSTKSSGVAYEPQMGGEESALKQVTPYSESSFGSASYSLYVDKPLMEQYYPGAQVGYSRVVVKSIAPAEASGQSVNIYNTAAPFTVNEFFTAKDFPVIEDETDMNTDPSILRAILIPGIYTKTAARQARSQGYSVVLNDMAGRQKKVSTFRRYPTPGVGMPDNFISSQEFVYQTKSTYNPNYRNELNNRVQVLTDDDTYRTGIIGQTFDVFIEREENLSTSNGVLVQLNFEIQNTPPFFLLIPIPKISETETSMKTIVTNKVIHRSGILKETIITTDQSRITTENLAYDIETGQPLLTKVTNEFKDPIYSYSYPASWYYNNMGGAYKNSDLDLSSLVSSYNSTNGLITFSTALSCLNVGDHVYVTSNNGASVTLANIFSIPSSTTITIIDKDGAYPSLPNTAPFHFYVVRSGRTNMSTTACGSIASSSLTGLNTTYTSGAAYDVKNKIINASAVEFTDNWRVPCFDCGDGAGDKVGVGLSVNVFRRGLKNIWRPYKSYAFVTPRVTGNNAQTDGYYDEFYQFNWVTPASSNAKWISAAAITRNSPFGFEVENKDALGVYSSAHYGYGNSLATNIGKNTRYAEMFFDGFEYDNYICTDMFYWTGSLQGTPTGLSAAQAHTGKKSLAIGTSSEKSQTITLNDTYLDPVCENANTLARLVTSCMCQGKFTFDKTAGKNEYIIGAWAKQVQGSTVYTQYSNAQITVEYKDISNATIGSIVTISPTGFIIEGWQRLEEKLTIPSNCTSVIIKLKNTSGTATVYFDDMRIHPFKSNMVSYVYDYTTFRLMSELDANNYATMYIYDQAGHLNKIKKETRDGVKTIKEGRTSNVREQ